MGRKRRRPAPFGPGWRVAEFDDDGELLTEVAPVRCPRCGRLTDLGGLDDTDVHRCAFCRTRTRWLWSEVRCVAVNEIRGPNPDWWEESWDELWRAFDGYDESEFQHDMYNGGYCIRSCEDPIFGGPAGEVQDRGRWVCAVCGAGHDEDEDGE